MPRGVTKHVLITKTIFWYHKPKQSTNSFSKSRCNKLPWHTLNNRDRPKAYKNRTIEHILHTMYCALSIQECDIELGSIMTTMLIEY